MIKARAWPVRAMYILIAAALAISLLIMVAPAHRVSADPDVESEWDMLEDGTPSQDGWVLAPDTYIIDYAVGDDGEVAYAIVNGWNEAEDMYGSWLLKSDDHAATWDDLSDELEEELEDDGYSLDMLLRVACDPEDSDFVAVALCTNEAVDTCVHVYISTDGGDTFDAGDTGEVEHTAKFASGWDVTDMAVSTADDGERDIAVVGQDDSGNAVIFRCEVDGDHAGKWKDARYDGWDDDDDYDTDPDPLSFVVTDVKFAPSWTADKTILVTTVVDEGSDTYSVYLQTGTWGTNEGWNEQSVASMPAVLINPTPVRAPLCLAQMGMQDVRGIAGLTLPLDYAGRYSNKRYVWVWVNSYSDLLKPVGTIFKVKDDDASPVGPMGQIEDGEVWLTNVDYLGYISEGKAIAGVMGTGGFAYNETTCETYDDIFTKCCEGVQVYHNDDISNMDICCEPWEEACKPPTGTKAMAAFYASDDPATSKAYAVALWGYITDSDEGAWSVSFDDGYTWNQLSLIDTYIDYLSDVAVSPDCNKTMLVSVNLDYWEEDVSIRDPDTYFEPWECVELDPQGGDLYDVRYVYCDSVWLHAENLPEAEEYSGKWLRTWCGNLQGFDLDDYVDDLFDVIFGGSGPHPAEHGLLRLAPEETTGDTVYLVDFGNDTVYWNEMETLGCWEDGTAEVDHIVDLAVKDKETIYALDFHGDVSMSDDYALGWHKPVDSEVKNGWTIAVWGDHVLVGGCDGDWNYSDDGAETWVADWDPEDVGSGLLITVAFDSYFDQNNTVYAAAAGYIEDTTTIGSVFRWIIGDSEEWEDLGAYPTEAQLGLSEDDDEVYAAFTGLVLDNADGNPMTSAETGGVLYASYIVWDENWTVLDSGVARHLKPGEDVVCEECIEWDYLWEGLTYTWDVDDIYTNQAFIMMTDALKICGCLTPDSNSKLFAIGMDFFPPVGYDMEDGLYGTVWTFEDCYAKKAPDLTSPDDGEVIDADPCSCYSEPFTLTWDRLCDACSYDLQIALDEDFDEVVLDSRYFCDEDGDDVLDPLCHYVPPAGGSPAYHILGGPAGGLSCETTYYWRVRAADAGTDQIIHSWWSDPRSVVIGPSVQAGEITLVSPEPGATGVAIKNVGFSWDLSATADSFDWVLDDNADLSSPVESKTGLTSTAYGCTQTLEYSTTYYWQVTAYNEGAEISTSAVGTFTTAVQGEFCCPQCGLCFDTQAELEDHIAEAHPAQPATPMWVWVVIAIGAVLVIVVIVLIFRTRRV